MGHARMAKKGAGFRVLQFSALAVCLALANPDAHAAGINCRFQSIGTMSLAFGNLDPSQATTVTMPLTGAVTIRSFGDCIQPSFLVTVRQGGNYDGTRRLKHTLVNDYIPYTLSVTDSQWFPGPGSKKHPYTLNFTGTIQPAAYQDAPAGNYADTVVIEVDL